MGREIELYRPRPLGGQGGEAPGCSRSDVRLMAQAIRGRWPVAEDERREVIERLLYVIRDSSSDPRLWVAAGSALIAADRVNLDDEARRTPQPQLVQEPDGRTRVRFDQLSDDELTRFLDGPL